MRRELLVKVTAGKILDRTEAREAGEDLASGRTEPLVTAAFLGALAARGETPGELAGLAEAFRNAVRPFKHFPGAVDTCGTGGDGRRTFNLSTAAALAVAALGQPVAKHGNRSVSSACGSADILQRLGFPVEESPPDAEARLEDSGFAFLYAPLYHPAMAHVAPVRRSMGVRTVFNLLGPLLNPAGVGSQIVGVYDASRMRLMAESLRALGTRSAMVIHGEGGYDEAVLHGRVFVAEIRHGAIDDYELSSADFGLPDGSASDIAGGAIEDNAQAFAALLLGGGAPGLRNAVAANAALALKAAGMQPDLREGAEMAREALASGRVGRYFAGLVGHSMETRHAQVS